MEAEPQVQTVVDLVHRRDELAEERKRRTSDIDAEIAKIDRALSAAGDAVQRAQLARPDAQVSLRGLKPVRAGSNGEKVIDAMSKSPNIGIAELAIAVYGEDTDATRHKIRAVQFHLRKSGRLPKAKETGQ